MRFSRYILAAAWTTLVVSSAVSARADLVQPRWGGAVPQVATERPLAVAQAAADLAIERDGAIPTIALVAQPDEASGAVGELPPVPDSSTLFLYALGTMGVWRLARVSWKWHVALAPDWYHTDAPNQIGHVKLVGWNLGEIEWLNCPFTVPTAARTPRRVCDADSDPPQGLGDYLPIFTPRGPPAACPAM